MNVIDLLGILPYFMSLLLSMSLSGKIKNLITSPDTSLLLQAVLVRMRALARWR